MSSLQWVNRAVVGVASLARFSPAGLRQSARRITAILVVGGLCAPVAHAGSYGTVKASSEGKDPVSGDAWAASAAFDGVLTTGWGEGKIGGSTGEWIEVQLPGPTQISGVSFWPGNLTAGTRSLREFGRPQDVTITLTPKKGDPITKTAHVIDPSETGPARVDVDVAGADIVSVRITVDKEYGGGMRDVTMIAEIALNFAAGQDVAAVPGVYEWLGSEAGAKVATADKAEVDALLARCQATQFGDREAFKLLADRAGDGAPFLRKQVANTVPAGFRLQALPPDYPAIEALLALKDPNAIPAFELAALRSRGAQAAALRDRVEYFHAFEQLVGGGRRNLPAWGVTGWEKGALQSLGEPIEIETDAFGNTYVADVANSRVQRFDSKGVSQQVWGGDKPDIASTWFGQKRAYYAAGSAPGTDKGQFLNPVALDQMVSKSGTTLVVLDAGRRVTVIGENGGIETVFSVPSESNAMPGVGGEAHVQWGPKGKIIVIWTNEGYVFERDGTQVATFQLKDGSPQGMVMLGGKMGLIYGKSLILYTLEGYRLGDVMGDALGTGFEAWGANVDEKGKLWAVLDTGKVIKFASPGHPKYDFQLTDWSLTVPRIAAYQDYVYVTSNDKIVKGDGIELHAQQALAKSDAEAGKKGASGDGEAP